MAIHAVIVPKWGLAMEEGKIVHWYVAPGMRVAPGDPIADIETSKITNTLEATEAGKVRRILAAPEETRACGALIAVIDDADASDAEIESYIASRPLEAVAAQSGAAGAAEPRLVGAEGRQLRALAMGSGGVPVVLLHGFGGDLTTWLFTQPALAVSRQVIALDLPGHGGSVKEVGDGSSAACAARIAEALRALGLARFHLVGHSLGGALALALATGAEAGEIASLALLAPAGLGSPVDQSFVAGFLDARRRRDLQAVLGRLFADPALVTAEMAEDVLRFKRLDGADAALRRIAEASLAAPPDYRAALAGLSTPALALWGDADRIVPAPAAEIAGVALTRLPGIGHMPHMEAAQAVNGLLAAHFARND